MDSFMHPDLRALVSFCAIGYTGLLKVAHRVEPSDLSHFLIIKAALHAALATRLLAPARYRARRGSVVLSLRLLLPCVIALMDFPHALGSLALVESPSASLAAAHFLFAVPCSAGAFHLLMPALGVPLPPLHHAAASALTAALIASHNAATCSSALFRHPLTAARLGLARTVLRPLPPLLEVPLVAAGLEPPGLQCHSVVLSMQLLAVLLPMLVLLLTQLRAYATHRRRCRQQDQLQQLQLLQQRQQWEGTLKWQSPIATAAEGAASTAPAAAADARKAGAVVYLPPHPAEWQYEMALRWAVAVQHHVPLGLIAPLAVLALLWMSGV